MAVLTTFANKKFPIHFIPIDTIYIAGNASTHFRPRVDSLQIGAILLGRLYRFIMSSGISCVIDISICWLLLHLLTPLIASFRGWYQYWTLMRVQNWPWSKHLNP